MRSRQLKEFEAVNGSDANENQSAKFESKAVLGPANTNDYIIPICDLG
jgi:hypothetical protein